MRIVIAEKPKVARAIAAAVANGKPAAKDGYLALDGLAFTWCFGHLLEQAQPDAYDPALKRWSLDALPFTVPAGQWKLIPRDGAKEQLRIVGSLIQRATEIVHAGDIDREGQLLVDEVLDHFQWNGKTLRMDTADLTPAALRKAWARLSDNAAKRPLYMAGLARQRADWLVGMNLTRAATMRIGTTASIGRVQTPTLALIVRRDREIEGHVKRHFWVLTANAANRTSGCAFVHGKEEAERIFDEATARDIAERLAGQVVDVAVQASVKTENAPLPHMLATFQKDAEASYGWSAKDALAALQAAYEAGYVTYPRTDCPHLPEEHRAQALAIADHAIARLDDEAYRELRSAMAASDAVYDDDKVTEHHAIIPTSKPLPTTRPESMREAEWSRVVNAWELIATRFLKSLLPPARYDVLEASFVFEGRTFRAKGESLRDGPSWRTVEPRETRRIQIDIAPGTTGKMRVRDVDVSRGETTPPKPYTEASLIADMRQAAKFATDPLVKSKLKESAGIGTPATQADIIETLKQRGYVQAVGSGKRKTLRSTTFGRYLIDNVPQPLADVAITALWEQQLSAIAAGEARMEDFLSRIERYVAKHVGTIKEHRFPAPPKPEEKPTPISQKQTKRRRKTGDATPVQRRKRT